MPVHLARLLQAADHVGGADAALVERLQVDRDAPAVERGVDAVAPMNDDRLSTAGS
jgi:hypothetical protein